ncbi:hypothetical protein AAZX31_10G092800 [Glycine max]
MIYWITYDLIFWMIPSHNASNGFSHFNLSFFLSGRYFLWIMSRWVVSLQLELLVEWTLLSLGSLNFLLIILISKEKILYGNDWFVGKDGRLKLHFFHCHLFFQGIPHSI